MNNDVTEIHVPRKRLFDVKKKNKNKSQKAEDIVTMSMELLLNKYLNNCKVRGLSPKTIKTYKDHNERFIKYLGKGLNIYNIEKVDSDCIEMYLVYLKDERKICGISMNTCIRNIKPFYRWLNEKKYITENPYERIKAIKTDKAKKQTLTNQEVRLILDHIDRGSFVGDRDYLITQMLYGCALRIDECLSLRVKDIKDDFIYIEKSKNREDDNIPLPDCLIKPLKHYIKRELKDFEDDVFLFPNTFGKKLHPQTYYRNLKKYGKKAGVPHVTCHLFRHSFAVNSIMGGVSTAVLQRLLRHKSLKTVEGYLHWLPGNVKEQFKKYNPLDKMYDE